MPKIKTSELTGVALDWAVAKAEGTNITLMRNDDGSLFPQPVWADGLWQQNYSTSWAQGGPIIEREKISIRQWTNVPVVHAYMPFDGADWAEDGTSPLIAGMRCYVSSKLGDEVEIPEELL